MSEWPSINDVDIGVRVEDLLGPLGYAEGDAVQPSIMEQIVSESERCTESMTGKAIYTCSEFTRITGRDEIRVGGKTISDKTLADSLEGARSFAVAVCTVGPEIDKIIEEHFKRGDYLQGMIADVTASRAVENVAAQCGTLICAEAGRLDLWASGRISPGYGKWDTSGQRPVFELLDPSPIGVSLNDYCMMEPKKSISFIVPFVEGEPDREEEPPCHACDFKNCGYRRK